MPHTRPLSAVVCMVLQLRRRLEVEGIEGERGANKEFRRVLDLGHGTGDFAVEIAEQYPQCEV